MAIQSNGRQYQGSWNPFEAAGSLVGSFLTGAGLSSPDTPYDQSRMDNLMAQRPEFGSILGENGQVLDQYRLDAQPYVDQIQGVKYDQSGLNALKDRALATGQSPWAAMQLQQGEMNRQDAMGRLGAQSNAALAGARSGLAMRGGLSGGAGASLARQAMRDRMAGAQGINRQDMTNRLNIGIQDQQQKDQFLSQLPGAQAQAFGAQLGQAQAAAQMGFNSDQWNMQNALTDLQQRRDFDMQSWLKNMEVEAANRQATATENAGKK